MMSERVILYPDPDQDVEHLWFEIGRYLGFQGIEDFRIVPNEDTVTTARLAAIGSHSRGLQGIELDATEAMIVKFRFQTITPEAYAARREQKYEDARKLMQLAASQPWASQPMSPALQAVVKQGIGMFGSLYAKKTP